MLLAKRDTPRQLELKGEAQRQLQLPRIKHRARRAVSRVGRAFAEVGAGAADRDTTNGAKIRGAIGGIEEADIYGVEQIEGFDHSLQMGAFGQVEGPRKTHIHALIRGAAE